jgi:hypothetical protein
VKLKSEKLNHCCKRSEDHILCLSRCASRKTCLGQTRVSRKSLKQHHMLLCLSRCVSQKTWVRPITLKQHHILCLPRCVSQTTWVRPVSVNRLGSDPSLYNNIIFFDSLPVSVRRLGSDPSLSRNILCCVSLAVSVKRLGSVNRLGSDPSHAWPLLDFVIWFRFAQSDSSRLKREILRASWDVEVENGVS